MDFSSNRLGRTQGGGEPFLVAHGIAAEQEPQHAGRLQRKQGSTADAQDQRHIDNDVGTETLAALVAHLDHPQADPQHGTAEQAKARQDDGIAHVAKIDVIASQAENFSGTETHHGNAAQIKATRNVVAIASIVIQAEQDQDDGANKGQHHYHAVAAAGNEQAHQHHQGHGNEAITGIGQGDHDGGGGQEEDHVAPLLAVLGQAPGRHDHGKVAERYRFQKDGRDPVIAQQERQDGAADAGRPDAVQRQGAAFGPVGAGRDIALRQIIRINIEQLRVHIDKQQLKKAHHQHQINNDFQEAVSKFLVAKITPKKIEQHQDDHVAEALGIERTAQQSQQQQVRGDQGQDRHERQFDAAEQHHGASGVNAQF